MFGTKKHIFNCSSPLTTNIVFLPHPLIRAFHALEKLEIYVSLPTPQKTNTLFPLTKVNTNDRLDVLTVLNNIFFILLQHNNKTAATIQIHNNNDTNIIIIIDSKSNSNTTTTTTISLSSSTTTAATATATATAAATATATSTTTFL